MKILFGIPILLFYIAYKFYGFYVATGCLMTTSLIQLLVVWFKHKEVSKLAVVTVVFIWLLGGATLFFHNEMFFKLKPTAFTWTLASTLLFNQWFSRKPLIQELLEKEIDLPLEIWKRLNLVWAIFFASLGLANLIVLYSFDTNTWVNFKLFGILGLSVVFVILQSIYLTYHNLQYEQTKLESQE